MIERYEERAKGVFDRELQRVITRGDAAAWRAYQAAVSAGAEVVPLPPVPPPARIDHAAQRIHRRIAHLERATLRPLREIAIADPAVRASALAKLAEIEAEIALLRAQLGGVDAEPEPDKKPKKEK